MRQRRGKRARAEAGDAGGPPDAAGGRAYWDQASDRDQRYGRIDQRTGGAGPWESSGPWAPSGEARSWQEGPGPAWQSHQMPGDGGPAWQSGPMRGDAGPAWQPPGGPPATPDPRRGARGGLPGRAARRRRPVLLIVSVVAAMLIAGLGAGGSYLLLRTTGSPAQTAAAYMRAWQRGSYRAMDAVSAQLPPGGVASWLTPISAQLGLRSTRLTLGQVTISGEDAVARFTARDVIAGGHLWTYHGLLRLIVRHRRWLVNWSPSAIYPALRAGQRFALTSTWPARAPVLAADGTVLSSPGAVAQSGSIALLTGVVVGASAAQAKALGPPYRAGDLIGLGGIEQAYQARLAGRPSLTVRLVGPGKRDDGMVARFAAMPGLPVRTSIEMFIQRAASRAVAAASTTKPVDMVVIEPSTGHVLAVVQRPGGFNRALDGIFPPGSTFKVVTASALVRTGMTPASRVQCPSHVTIDGRTFHNDANEHLGSTTLLKAFAISCNSTFALLATRRLTGGTLGAMAASYGFNARPALGIPARLGTFSRPRSAVDLAADAFGQGTDLVNPLSQASVAAAVASGTWRPPRLVLSPAPRQVATPRALSGAVLAALRPMMRAVVTSGTAAGVGFGPGVYGKTGTAEYLSGSHLRSHGWFIGYRGDLAFAVLVEGGGFGASSAGPIANAFLHRA